MVFVSSQLDVSERYIASLMQQVISQRPNITLQQTSPAGGSEKLVEASILEFHSRRRHLAESLRYIVEAAVLGQHGMSEVAVQGASSAGAISDVYRQLELFVRQEILAPEMPAAPGALAPTGFGLGIGLPGRSTSTTALGGFPLRLLREIERTGGTIEKVKAARQNARTETVGPSQGQGALTLLYLTTI